MGTLEEAEKNMLTWYDKKFHPEAQAALKQIYENKTTKKLKM